VLGTAVTDAAGAFAFSESVTGDLSLFVTALGFRPVRMNLIGATPVTIDMVAHHPQLQGIVVTASSQSHSGGTCYRSTPTSAARFETESDSTHGIARDPSTAPISVHRPAGIHAGEGPVELGQSQFNPVRQPNMWNSFRYSSLLGSQLMSPS
jgi:hypothetical protein